MELPKGTVWPFPICTINDSRTNIISTFIYSELLNYTKIQDSLAIPLFFLMKLGLKFD